MTPAATAVGRSGSPNRGGTMETTGRAPTLSASAGVRRRFEGLPRARVLRILARLDALPQAECRRARPTVVSTASGAQARVRPGILRREELELLIRDLRLDWSEFVAMT